QHRARTTLRQAAPEPGPVQMQLVVQHIQQRRIQARRHAVHKAVDLDLQLARHTHPPIDPGRKRPPYDRAGTAAIVTPRSFQASPRWKKAATAPAEPATTTTAQSSRATS